MGLFDKLFSDSKESNEQESIAWIDLNRMQQLDEIVERSTMKTQLIFKHSTRCGVSRMVISQFKKDYQLSEKDADLYYLDLLNYRDISDEIAVRFAVTHESPQLLVIKNGISVTHANHGRINDVKLKEYLS